MTRSAAPRQLEFAIDRVPKVIRDHGLVEAHSYPQVSMGKGADGRFGSSYRVPAQQAFREFPSVELRSATAWPSVVLDLDYQDSREELYILVLDGEVPRPNWVVQRGPRGGCHVTWNLARPVLRGAHAREKPLQLLGRVSEYLAQKCGADRGYRGVLSHNPYGRAKNRRGLKTNWGRTRPYELSELSQYIPTGWRRPRKPITTYGRNCALFAELMKFAGAYKNMRADLEAAALELVDVFVDSWGVGLPVSEVLGIAKSVNRYRDRWIAQGLYYVDPGKQAHRGKLSGVSRRSRTESRDQMIVNSHFEGQTTRQIANAMKLPQQTVAYVLKRDHAPCDCAPMFRELMDGDVRDLRAEGLTQAQIGEVLGVTQSAVSKSLNRPIIPVDQRTNTVDASSDAKS